MSVNSKTKADPDTHTDRTNTFNIQVYTDEGRLIDEYTMDPERDKVSTLGAAEDSARKRLTQRFFEPLILIVTEQTLTKLCQVQVKVASRSR
jgi:hypothetical protein